MTSCAVSASVSGDSPITAALRCPPPHVGALSNSSGRAVPTTISGTPETHCKVVHEVQEHLVGPVQILEHDDEGPGGRDRLQEPPCGSEELVP